MSRRSCLRARARGEGKQARWLCCIHWWQHRQVKYLYNRLEADHGALKRLISPTRGFNTLPTASATIKGFEVMPMIRKRKCLMLEPGAAGEVCFVNRLFRLAA
jgi:transposase-like protein